MGRIEDYLIEALVKIANDKKFLKLVEPQIMQPQELKYWMVQRTLYAWGLLLKEGENNAISQNNTS